MWKLFFGWLLLLALIVLAAQLLLHEDDTRSNHAAGPSTLRESNADIELLKRAMPACNQTLFGFLTAGTPEARNQFVLSPVETAVRMARFYNLSPMIDVEPETLALDHQAALKLPGVPAVETTWESPDGKLIEAVFREVDGEWLLDWNHFARYGDYPWSLFLAGSGPPEGEFCLLARERLADQRKNVATISLVFYAPRFARPTEAGFQSPEFLVSRRSPDGRLLEAAFKLARNGGAVFGSKMPNRNPEGMIRVRVKVRRLDVGMNRTFELDKVLACHWYSVDDPGVEPEPDKNPSYLRPPDMQN